MDVVFEMAGGEVFDASYRALAHFGRIVVCGIASQRAQPGVAPARCCATRARWSASTCSTAWSARRCSPTRWPTCSRAPRAASCRRSSGHTYPLGEAAQAQIDLRERRTTGKLLLDPAETALSSQAPLRMTKTFAELGLSEPTLQALRDVGYESPSPIQEQAIPPLLEGRDVIGQAQTGTGKTAAFGLPIMEYVDPSEHEVQALVLTPTRELCIQVTQALRTYGAPQRASTSWRCSAARRSAPSRPSCAPAGTSSWARSGACST